MKDFWHFCQEHDIDPKSWGSIEAWERGWVTPSIDVSDGRALTFDDVVELIGGQLGTFNVPCPYCGANKPSSTRFQIKRPSLSSASYRCFYCGRNGSVRSDGPVDPVKEAEARKRAAQLDAESKAERTAKALRLWEDATAPLPSVVMTYLQARAIFELPPDVDQVLRWHPAAPFGRDGRRGVLLALFRDVTADAPVAVHRTAILHAATGKAERMALGPITRAAIQLWPITGDHLVVGEGIETVLAAAGSAALERQVGEPLRPAWALAVANNVASFPVVNCVRRLLILEDNDESRAGERAAQSCERRYVAAGRSCARLRPTRVGCDFNDIVKMGMGHD